jgi:proteasome lid subunit RPN8/RPN11
MIIWKNEVPDYKIHSLQDLFSDFGIIDGLRLLYNAELESVVIVSHYAKQKTHRHLTQKRIELGGLLIGKVYEINSALHHNYVTVVKNSIPSHDFISTTVSLNIGPDVWNSAHMYKAQGLDVVGWYHSHPGIGAFFSSTDRHTQSHFFKEQFQIGYVEDPYRREELWFYGKNSNAVRKLFNY